MKHGNIGLRRKEAIFPLPPLVLAFGNQSSNNFIWPLLCSLGSGCRCCRLVCITAKVIGNMFIYKFPAFFFPDINSLSRSVFLLAAPVRSGRSPVVEANNSIVNRSTETETAQLFTIFLASISFKKKEGPHSSFSSLFAFFSRLTTSIKLD